MKVLVEYENIFPSNREGIMFVRGMEMIPLLPSLDYD